MNTKILLTVLLTAVMLLTSQNPVFAAAGNTGSSDSDTLYLQIGNKTLTVTLADNSAAKELKELLSKNSITIDMSDYGGFEKVGGLGTNITTNNENITTESGDMILYQGNQLVIFYGSNAWSYTRLGKINDVTQTELKNMLGSGNVTVTLFLNDFGEVPNTGVPDLTFAVVATVMFFIVSAALWSHLLRRKAKKI